MKTSIAFALAAAFSLVAAQSVDPGPAPTESYGCEPHGDHWHCEGPITVTTAPTVAPVAPTTIAAVITSTAAPEDHGDDDHTDHPASTGASVEPSPTESIGCEPHGDHWHCDGPRETTSAPAVITSAPADTASAPASTLSTTAVAAGNSTSTSTQSPIFTGAANARKAGLGLVGGLLMLPFAL